MNLIKILTTVVLLSSMVLANLIGVSESKIPKTNMVKNLYTQNLVEGQYSTVEGKKVVTSKGSKATTTSKKPNGKYVFENDDIFIELKKITNQVGLGILIYTTYTNRTEKPLTIEIKKKASSITDDMGGKWNNINNTIIESRETIEAGRKLSSRMNFRNFSGSKANLFDIKLSYKINGKDVNVKFYEVPIK